MSAGKERALAHRLNRDCYCLSADVPALRQWLEQDFETRGLEQPIVSTHPHLFSATPVFVAEEHAAQMRNLIEAVEAVAASPAYREAVLSDAPSIARTAPAARGVFLGYDFHLTDAGPKLIEINTNAGGALLNVALHRAQRACCVEVERHLRGQPGGDALEETFFRMFECEWHRARKQLPCRCVAIVDDTPQDQYLYPEFLLFQRLFEARGIAALIVAPSELRYERSALWYGEQRIDMVYNRLTDFYFQDPAHAALAGAYVDDAAVITPHPHAHALYANKRNLTVLTDEAQLRALHVADETIRVLLQGIPRTAVPTAADHERWWSERKQWFFKPATGFGSRGSYRGDKLTRKTFADIMQGDYVAQSFVPPSERRMSDEATQRPLKLDLRNYVYAGATQLMAARLYRGQTTNFRTPGGGFAPVYLIL